MDDLLKFESEQFKIIFGTKDNAIDIQTLRDVLNEMSAIVDNIGTEYRISKVIDFNIEFKIEAFNKGSFELLSSILPVFSDLTIFATIKDAIQFVPMIIDIFKIKKIFKEEKLPDEVVHIDNQNKIDINNGTVIINQNTFNVYTASVQSLSKLFGIIDVNPNIDAFEINDEKEKLEFSKDEISELKVLKEINSEESSTSQITGQITSLRSADPAENRNQIDIKGLIDNKVSSVASAVLDSEDYQIAIDAHKSKKYVKIIGELTKLKTKYKFTRVDQFFIL